MQNKNRVQKLSALLQHKATESNQQQHEEEQYYNHRQSADIYRRKFSEVAELRARRVCKKVAHAVVPWVDVQPLAVEHAGVAPVPRRVYRVLDAETSAPWCSFFLICRHARARRQGLIQIVPDSGLKQPQRKAEVLISLHLYHGWTYRQAALTLKKAILVQRATVANGYVKPLLSSQLHLTSINVTNSIEVLTNDYGITFWTRRRSPRLLLCLTQRLLFLLCLAVLVTQPLRLLGR